MGSNFFIGGMTFMIVLAAVIRSIGNSHELATTLKSVPLIGATGYAPQIIAGLVALIGIIALPLMIFRDGGVKIEAVGEGVSIFSGTLAKAVFAVLLIVAIGYLFGTGFSAVTSHLFELSKEKNDS